MPDGFDPEKLRKLIDDLDDVCAEATRLRKEVEASMDRARAHGEPASGVTASGSGKGKKRRE